MFSRCLSQVMDYTRPVLISTRFYDGTIQCGGGTFIILNKEGWILTAAHILQANLKKIEDQTEIIEYEDKLREINSNTSFTPPQKKRNAKKLQYNPKWIRNNSYWWGENGYVIDDFVFDRARDIAVGKIANFNSASVSSYPIFKNPNEPMPTGTSLCKLGFPFHNFTSTFDEATQSFILSEGTLPVPFFPLDGIHTRLVNAIEQNSGRTTTFLETSTPGLKGQSGGPTFDNNGNIWALQSQTHFLNLDFAPQVVQGTKITQEHQFINVGWGTSVTEILNFLREQGVDVQLSSNS